MLWNHVKTLLDLPLDLNPQQISLGHVWHCHQLSSKPIQNFKQPCNQPVNKHMRKHNLLGRGDQHWMRWANMWTNYLLQNCLHLSILMKSGVFHKDENNLNQLKKLPTVTFLWIQTVTSDIQTIKKPSHRKLYVKVMWNNHSYQQRGAVKDSGCSLDSASIWTKDNKLHDQLSVKQHNISIDNAHPGL